MLFKKGPALSERQRVEGFTLIELLVSIAIIGIAMGIGISALASILKSSTKASIFNTVKQNGDFAMETMVRSVRNAVDLCTEDSLADADTKPDQILIYPTKVNCPTVATPMTVFRCNAASGANGAITKDGNAITNESVSDPKRGVKVEDGSCDFIASDTVPKRVTIRFVLTQGFGLTSVESQVKIPFESEVTLRNL